MLPSQQAMMLDLAYSFEKIVKNPKNSSNKDEKSSVITWDTPKELETYILKLQGAADLLTSQNRRLRKYHEMITDLVLQMMNIDLVRSQQRCKECLNQIRVILSTVEESGVKTADTLPWRNFWDYQLYKAVESQYRFGLESMNELLPEIKVDVVYKHQRLQFRPPFEEIRAKYYRELKSFVKIPMLFNGLGEGKIFSQMIEKNDKSLLVVYRKADALFQKLAKVLEPYKEWVILGSVDIDEFCQEVLVDVADWELNFKILKQKGKEAEQLPAQIQVDCISVSTIPVKSTIDNHLQGLMDSMISALRKAIIIHMNSIEEFAGKGLEILSDRPKTLEEIGEANKAHEKIYKSKSLIQSHFDGAEVKNKLLQSVSGARVDTTTMQAKWNKLELMLQGHELMIKEQMDVFKSAIETRVISVQAEIDKFGARWKQLKPEVKDVKTTEGAIKAIAFVVERKQEFKELLTTVEQINVDSAHFGLENPVFEDLEELSSDIDKSEQTWSSLKEWIDSISKVVKEDWISFRSKLHVLEELLANWSEKIKSQKMTSILAHIQKEVDLYKSIMPLLKVVRGECWSTEHWGELFHLVSIPKGVTISDLNVGHFIHASSAMLSKSIEITELNNRALGEVGIREAIQELDLWGAGAVYTMTNYVDGRSENIKLIKDWKEMLAQLGDNQSLLQSLKDSPYYKNFADRAMAWETKLAELDECLRNLNTVQRKWVYLEPIFSRGALPSEAARFSRIDDDFRSIMHGVARDDRIVSILGYSNLRSSLISLVYQLERCQKALNEFLEEKRSKFARFYFLGDEDCMCYLVLTS
jgi:dynein heavy chain 2